MQEDRKGRAGWSLSRSIAPIAAPGPVADVDRNPDAGVMPDKPPAIASPAASRTTAAISPRRVAFLDLSIKDRSERAAILAAIETVLRHGQVIVGPEVAELERRVTSLCGRRHGIGVGSGTDALLLGLKAIGIGAGDEVVTTPLSWLATASAILANGATPVFADIDETLNIDPATIEALITPRTRAILPVHFTGRLARMAEIGAIARRHRLLVIEDGSQALGATLHRKPCGSFGDLACLSLGPMKLLGALGDAGIILTDDEHVAERLRRLRHSGVVDRDTCLEVSHNCRLDTVQAAVLLQRLGSYRSAIARRQAIAARYNRELAGLVGTPPVLPGYQDVFYTYTIRTPHRDALRRHLADAGIETRIHHPILMPDQPAFQGRVRGRYPRAAQLVGEILSIPVHEKLGADEQDLVVAAIREFFEAAA
jgi:dTDP-4-amino-4,6-dideoxygalactose transaminase